MNYNTELRAFVRTLLITTLVIAVVSVIVFSVIPSWHYPPVFPFLLAFFFFATLVVYHFMLKAMEKRPARFVNIFLMTTMIKLFAYMAVMVTYALLNREGARPFIVAFFVLYIIYTIIEVASLLSENHKIDIN